MPENEALHVNFVFFLFFFAIQSYQSCPYNFARPQQEEDLRQI